MAPINTMSVLAFATAAFAVPYHGHGHAQYHNNKPSGFSAFPYPSANGTGIYASGTGFATGAPIAPASETVAVSDVETTAVVATTYADVTSTCTSEVTVTATVKKTVTVTPTASSAPSSSAASLSAAKRNVESYGKTGKRGVSYDDAKLTECLTESPAISWGYNWGSSSSGLSDSVKFVPTLWGPASKFTDDWSKNAKSAIESGSTHLFSFNEPDLGEQANLTPAEAASAYKQYMEPFAGKAKLCAPSVTNGGGSMGLNWLSSFLEACSDCTIDCVNIHWYDSAENVEYFKKHINDTVDIADDKEIFLSEFAATGSDDQISEFLETVMPWMDSNDAIAGYAYFMAADGKLVSGSEQSAIGKTYASS